MLFGPAVGLVLLALMVFCIIGMVLLVGGQFLSGQKITKEHIACVSGLVPVDGQRCDCCAGEFPRA